MPDRGQANIGIRPKSSEYSRCLGITWNVKATIGTFCSDFLVRDCLHSLFATTLFFPCSEENKTLIKTAASLFVDTSLTNGISLCTKIQSSGTCISGGNAVRPTKWERQHGLLTERFSKAKCAVCIRHPCTRITSRGCHGRRGRGKGREHASFPRCYKKCRSVIWHSM